MADRKKAIVEELKEVVNYLGSRKQVRTVSKSFPIWVVADVCVEDMCPDLKLDLPEPGSIFIRFAIPEDPVQPVAAVLTDESGDVTKSLLPGTVVERANECLHSIIEHQHKTHSVSMVNVLKAFLTQLTSVLLRERSYVEPYITVGEDGVSQVRRFVYTAEALATAPAWKSLETEDDDDDDSVRAVDEIMRYRQAVAQYKGQWHTYIQGLQSPREKEIAQLVRLYGDNLEPVLPDDGMELNFAHDSCFFLTVRIYQSAVLEHMGGALTFLRFTLVIPDDFPEPSACDLQLDPVLRISLAHRRLINTALSQRCAAKQSPRQGTFASQILRWLDSHLEDVLGITEAENSVFNAGGQGATLNAAEEAAAAMAMLGMGGSSKAPASDGNDTKPENGDAHDSSGSEGEEEEECEEEEDFDDDDDHGHSPSEMPEIVVVDPPSGSAVIQFGKLNLSNIELALCQVLRLQVSCIRCKQMAYLSCIERIERHGIPLMEGHTMCEGCSASITAVYCAFPMHPYADDGKRMGWVKVNGGSIICLLPRPLHMWCTHCSEQSVLDDWNECSKRSVQCETCFTKLVIDAGSAIFKAVQQSISAGSGHRSGHSRHGGGSSSLPGFPVGKPLPKNGTCKHYKRSFRWFRFPCCGKVYPCDNCHDDAEPHKCPWATRVICGHCAQEQPSGRKECSRCNQSFTGSGRSGYWHGGSGCRDTKRMNRKDSHKFKNKFKTKSRKQREREARARKKGKAI